MEEAFPKRNYKYSIGGFWLFKDFCSFINVLEDQIIQVLLWPEATTEAFWNMKLFQFLENFGSSLTYFMPLVAFYTPEIKPVVFCFQGS